jgi:ribosome biogenesis protein NSA2
MLIHPCVCRRCTNVQVMVLLIASNSIAAHEEKTNKHKNADTPEAGAIPAYLEGRETVSRAKVLSNSVKQKRKEKAGKWSVPVPKVRPITEAEMFKVLKTGKKKSKAWKRVVTKVTFVGDGFTRKPPKVID